MKNELTQEEYLQVVGLLKIASDQLTILELAEKSLKKVFRVKKSDEKTSGIGNPEHIGDAIYSRYSADELLEKLGVTLEPEKEGRG